MLIILVLFGSCASQNMATPNWLSRWFDKMNEELAEINQKAANMTWLGMIGQLKEPVLPLAVKKVLWRELKCREAGDFPQNVLDDRQQRMIYLLCRGPRESLGNIRLKMSTKGRLSSMYEETRICMTKQTCLKAEPDLDLLMRRIRDPENRLRAWQGFRDVIGPLAFDKFNDLIKVENEGARAAGYNDIGECWREELEMPRLTEVIEDLYQQILPLYELLRRFVHYRMNQYYGNLVPLDEPIPAHLLGNMWSSSWDNMIDLIAPSAPKLDSAVQRLFPRPVNMLTTAEDYYSSMGFPPLSKTFWSKSIYSTQNGTPHSCHGTAANLYSPGDVRMLLCTQINWEDLYVVHHEIGHIHYFMSYDQQPMIFQEGANSAFQEAIGDTIMLSVSSPTHLQRLGLLPNISAETEMTLLLVSALNKIPQLPYGLILEKWRWNVMSSKVKPADYNKLWWQYRRAYEGIRPPGPRCQKNLLDPIAKFHIADNTPYIRYFLSGFIQFQLLDVMCSNFTSKGKLLHRCDLYNNKDAGQKLKSLMKSGNEKKWNEALENFSDGKYSSITAEPLLKYYSPLTTYLSKKLEELENVDAKF